MAMIESPTKTPYAVHCNGDHGTRCNRGALLFLTSDEYDRQFSNPNVSWRCPRCGGSAEWDDDNYEKHFPNDREDGQ